MENLRNAGTELNLDQAAAQVPAPQAPATTAEPMSTGDESLSALIGGIYDASLDPGLWPAVFDEICEFVDCAFASVVFQDALGRTASVYLTSTQDPRYRQLFLEKYFRLNPIFPMIMFSQIEQTISAAPEVLPREEFVQTQFAREWLTPQGFLDALLTVLEKSATTCTYFTVIRRGRQGLFDAEARRRFELVVPHVRRAALIGKTLDMHKLEAAALADTLDTIGAGVLLADGGARLTHANASGHALLAQGDVLSARGGRLVARDPQADRLLRDALGAAENGDTAMGRKGIEVGLGARDGARYLAHALPLKDGARRKAGASYDAVAALFVRQAALDSLSPLEALAGEFRLTPAEVRVLRAIVDIGGVREVAPVLGVSEPTVKSHLRSIYDKTGARRQADLVKLVAAYVNPLRTPSSTQA